MSFSWLWSRGLLTDRRILWLLLISNLVGTLYGYVWYGVQLADVWNTRPAWQIVFVPDSPTASLFFTLAVLGLLFPPSSRFMRGAVRLIEALAVVTSVKYGVWAVSIIFWDAALGQAIEPLSWMLIASHGIMAAEALLYVRFFSLGTLWLIPAAIWTFANDTVDYTYGVFPYLSAEHLARLDQVRNFTFALTAASVLAGWLAIRGAGRGRRSAEPLGRGR
ncbi:DUF1405 domain-containing protein [Saccharibacillus alkalitolerans]|uniref:DUF1405 domain-containing protein n=1 Tax=Saccharibacillus alkalitolerans TaxID=2705290 RepID=A0ABX0F158_9BACL|nr:DUF1405 domain-containing protein [Saccharibacillus alkalitolerans]NGZ74267.1 DUF1405 domain-containing protein [Saccharibacillus alkalitolerans]